ncbi:MAG: hypothetical protein HC857_11715, partial [Synechococcales cyanobacterium RU_4_20]|nr:hypothetical protein [Synechococcales cyanobacterium RU_4_20]
SDDLLEEAKQQPFALRYILIHDLFHTLLGFDTSYAGELGVQGFITGQNYSRALHLTGPLVQLITMLIRPLQARAISRNFRQGKALGQQAHCVLTFPFEQNWARPIQAIRKELNLPQVSHSLSSQPAVPSLKTVGWKGEASA